MSHVERYLKTRERPPFAKGVKEAVKAKDTPLGFTNPSCCFCGAGVFDNEFAIHHEVPWVVIKEWLLKDYDFQVATEDQKLQAILDAYNYIANLRAAHRVCNSADGNRAREYEAHKRHVDRVDVNGEWWHR